MVVVKGQCKPVFLEYVGNVWTLLVQFMGQILTPHSSQL